MRSDREYILGRIAKEDRGYGSTVTARLPEPTQPDRNPS